MTKSIDEMSKPELRIAIAERDVIIRSLKQQLVYQPGTLASPGYAPGSPEEAAYAISEKERRQRADASANAAPSDVTVRQDLHMAYGRLQQQKNKNDGG